MIRHYIEGVLFFGGGRELRVVDFDVSRTSALLHVHGLGLLPVSFFVSFDSFLTVGKCRLTWSIATTLASFLKHGLTWRPRPAVECLSSARSRL
jgi:hypothetical protein